MAWRIMKTKEQILKELEIRRSFRNPKSYGSKRINETIMHTLEWVLDIPNNIKSHYDMEKYK